MAALSATIQVERLPVGNLVLVNAKATVTSAGGHIPKEDMGISEIVGILGGVCMSTVAAPQVTKNSDDGTEDSSPGDLWLDAAATITVEVTVLAKL
jgi:hypothetical protein